MKAVCGFEKEGSVCACVKYLFEFPQGVTPEAQRQARTGVRRRWMFLKR